MYRRLTVASLPRSAAGRRMASQDAASALRAAERSFSKSCVSRVQGWLAGDSAPSSRPHHRSTVLNCSRTCAIPTSMCGEQRRTFFSFSRPSHKEEEQLFSAAAKESGSSSSSSSATATPTAAATASASSTVPPAIPAEKGDAEPAAPSNSHAAAQAELEEKLIALRQNYLEPYDAVYRFLSPLKSTTPMVMMLGNHSSGKSTLINYLAGREIQETGIAPTDDGFTVIRRDSFDMDTDGPSVVSNPKYQYQSLQQFGISFVTHFKMKTRTMAANSRIPMDMVLVDTPGMIDTPLHASKAQSAALSPSEAMYGSDHTRGYDFLGATRWFAQQSDVILLMFDPANPGTTGETLDVLTKSLAGYEHKFLLVMNKADLFEKVTDFARAYGTLCWNLSKVMKMKDIPRVYTTCTPLAASGKPATVAAGEPLQRRSAAGTVPEAELARQRNQILEEIMSAPIRRMDNLITETEDSTRNLLLAMRAAKILRQDYRQRELLCFSALGSACLLCPATAVALSSVSLTGTLLVTLLSIAVGCGGVIGARAYLKEFERKTLESSDYVLNRIYTAKTRTKDVELRWQRTVKPEIMRVVSTYHDNGANGIRTLPTCSARACRGMEALVNEEVPALRRAVMEYKEAYFRTKDKRASRRMGK